MKKIYVAISMSLFLAACAENPPAWWNPRNLQPGQTATATRPAAVTKRAVSANQTPVNMEREELIALPDEEYEEMSLTPLQDEEQENESGESSAQVTEEAQDTSLVPSILEE